MFEFAVADVFSDVQVVPLSAGGFVLGGKRQGCAQAKADAALDKDVLFHYFSQV
jgi:hypothetical protein